jgi:hypothetical protein
MLVKEAEENPNLTADDTDETDLRGSEESK